ncbi:hypothetical protein [Herbaspirillum sp. NPDC101396]|uniref:hypothetical protein n=1 Tax=Herbaspirillum sp. NPDC101396 TaxID=3364005 RepID=UPI00383AC5DF
MKQDAAEIFVEKIVGYYEPRTAIRTFDKEGCFSGYTYVTDSARLYANNEAFMHMWKNTDRENICTFDYSFVPEKNAKYKATTTQVSVPNGKRRLTITGWQPVEQLSCEFKLVQIGADGSETAVQTRGYRLTNDNQCSKLVPRKDATVTK